MASRDDASRVAKTTGNTPDTVRILAVRVQFGADNDSRTTGNGQFIVTASADSSLDAPPHDAQYFRDHLQFLENYFRKVSRGKLILRATLLDSVVTLPVVMATYSPPKNGPNTLIADLVRDTWRTVDSLRLVTDLSSYQCFLVFHAGAGRDVDLVSTLGYDPTPLDIPSLYIGLNALRYAFGADYKGIAVQNSTFFITHTLLLPETENRLLPGVGGDVPLQLGINGLLCASFGNFLGLPDLFDTQTGRSGIGRFGLMDGQAIFSYSGLFPPEPSAWEKYWLGWVTPITVDPGTTTVTLPAVGWGTVDPARSDTIYRVPISASEYYLLENRNRDPQQNGQRITFSLRGVPRLFSFSHDTTGFAAFDISRAVGVLTDVEDIDWSLPNLVDSDGAFFDGGILIWHIDESVIHATIATNGVNADPKHRGVDVEEADGSQDIGQQYGQFTGGSGSEEGTALDFWFRGNPSPVNKNEFTSLSFPNTRTNAGANSHVAIQDFSVRGPRMTATVTVGDAQIAPLAGYPRSVSEKLTDGPGMALTAADVDGDGIFELLVTTTGEALSSQGATGALLPSKLHLLRLAGPGGSVLHQGVIALSSGTDKVFVSAPAFVRSQTGQSLFFLSQSTRGGGTVSPGSVGGFAFADQNGDSLADLGFQLPVSRGLGYPPVVADSVVAFSASGNAVYLTNFAGTRLDSLTSSSPLNLDVAGTSRWTLGSSLVVAAGSTLKTVPTGIGGPSGPPEHVRDFGEPIRHAPAVATFRRDNQDQMFIVFVTDRNLFCVDQTLTPLQGYPRSGSSFSQPAIADVNGDGARDIVVFAGTEIWAFNLVGVPLDNFPIQVPSTLSIDSTPVVADVDGDGIPEVIAVTQDGLVCAYTRRGKMATGFPLQAGPGPHSVAVVDAGSATSTGTPIGVVVANAGDGSISGWVTGYSQNSVTPAGRPWPQYQKDALHSGYDPIPLVGSPLSSDFFPTARAYNWPNPAYGGKTMIRYYVRDNARVRIKIFDIAGDLVADFAGPGVGGLDNEVPWDVSGIQSGVYFARIEATGDAGSGIAMVKIAVVK